MKIENTEYPKMTYEEFISKTKKMLKIINANYSQSWKNRELTEDEIQSKECDNCNNSCTHEINGRNFDVNNNYENGSCVLRYFDSEEFSDSMEDLMFHDDSSPFFDLLSCELN